MDIATYAAAVGAAKRYTDEHSGSGDAVKYTEQDLTTAQKAQARENIGAAAAEELPTPEQEAAWSAQANWNERSGSSASFINNKPPIQTGSGTGGNIEGGTGITERMNSARYANSVAYGYMANADGNYTLAYGEGVMARHHYEIALGKYNVSNADTAFSIGDGPGVGADSRHNLMELKTDGRLFLNGYAVIVPEVVTGYDATKTQVLKNINGTLMWVDDT